MSRETRVDITRRRLRYAIAKSGGTWTFSPREDHKLVVVFALSADQQAYAMLTGGTTMYTLTFTITDIDGNASATVEVNNRRACSETCHINVETGLACSDVCHINVETGAYKWAYVPQAGRKRVVEMLVTYCLPHVRAVLDALRHYRAAVYCDVFSE